MSTTDAPVLSHYRITGSYVHDGQGTACDYCGTGIKLVVTVAPVAGHDDAESPIRKVGADCAERIGLDAEEVRQLFAERRRELRIARERARAEAAAAADRAKVTGMVAETVILLAYAAAAAESCERMTGHALPDTGWDDSLIGLYCAEAVAIGNDLAIGRRVRPVAVENALRHLARFVRRSTFRGVEQSELKQGRALFDLDGNLLDARLVDGKFGLVWRIEAGGGRVEWFNPSKARNVETARRNNAAKGYYVGTVLFDSYRDRTGVLCADRQLPPVVIEDNGQGEL